MNFVTRLWSAVSSVPLLWLLLAALLFGLSQGAVFGRLPLLAKLAEQDAAQAKEKFRAAERAAQVLQAAQTRSDELTQTLATQQTQINKLKKERLDAIQKVTTGRTCLDGSALRVLNGAAGIRVSGFPAPIGSIATADGAATANTNNGFEGQANLISTDTDIGGWAIDAGAQYEICRKRLGALIDWFDPSPPSSVTR